MLKKETLKIIFKYAFPNIISMWIFTLYTMIDGIFISKFIGKNALAGVNLVLPLINFIFSISIMLAVGSSTLISIKFGESKFDEGNKILTSALIINFILGIFISITILFFHKNIINFLGASSESVIYYHTREYLLSIIPFSIFYMLGYAIEIYIKVDGKPSYPVYCVLFGGVSNLILDYIFILKFGLGVKGAGIATGISQMTTCSLLLYYILFKGNVIKLKKNSFSLILKQLNIFKLGFPEFLTEISSGILILIYNLVILKNIGVKGLAIYGVISYITSFITMTMIGFSQGIQPLISYNLGKKQYYTLKEFFNISIYILIILGFFTWGFINIFSLNIGNLFFEDYNLILELKKILNIFSLSYIILGINIFVSSYFTAIKRPLYSSLITFPRTIFLNALLLVILPLIFDNNSIWIVSFLSELITIFICIFLLKKDRSFK